MFSKRCRAHLQSVGETGVEHAKAALETAVRLQLLVPALLIHSVAPGYFTKTATKTMKDILEKRK